MTALQWLNANSYRKYPFKEDFVSELVASSDTLQIPDSFLLDLQWVAYSSAEPAGKVLTLYSITPADDSFRELLLQFKLGSSTFADISVPYTVTTAPMRVMRNGVQLSLVFGDGVGELLDSMSDIGSTDPYVVTPATSEQFEPALRILQNNHRVTGIVGDTDTSQVLTGKIYWQEGYNTRVTLSNAASVLRIVATPGAGAGVYCARMESDRSACSDILLAINELYADGTGSFKLTGGNGISITPDPDNNTLVIRTSANSDDVSCGVNNE